MIFRFKHDLLTSALMILKILRYTVQGTPLYWATQISGGGDSSKTTTHKTKLALKSNQNKALFSFH